jgi:hypothetical protein
MSMYATAGMDDSRVLTRDAATLLARFLHAEAGGESVRTREALAAVAANQVARRLRWIGEAGRGGCIRRLRAKLFLDCLVAITPDAGEPDVREPRAVDDHSYAASLRIAQRAVSGALQDPTHGANRHHPLGNSPEWARGLTPCAYIGGFLFYDDASATNEASPCTDGQGRLTDADSSYGRRPHNSTCLAR